MWKKIPEVLEAYEQKTCNLSVQIIPLMCGIVEAWWLDFIPIPMGNDINISYSKLWYFPYVKCLPLSECHHLKKKFTENNYFYLSISNILHGDCKTLFRK